MKEYKYRIEIILNSGKELTVYHKGYETDMEVITKKYLMKVRLILENLAVKMGTEIFL